MIRKGFQLNPSQLLIVIFTSAILIGTVLLLLPISTIRPISVLDAFFTATSAVTCTGLVSFDVGKTFTIVGQIIILILIQLGGLGIMSFALLIFIMIGKKIRMKDRILVQQSLNQTNVGGMGNLVKNLFKYSITIEIVAIFILFFYWWPKFGWVKALYYAFFHSISAFNNAGFSPFSDNLMGFVGDPVVNLVITSLIIIGGLGFTVLSDIRQKKSFRRLMLHTKIMIYGTLLLNLLGLFIFLFLEFGNPKTLGELVLPDKLWASYFQSVTLRTAGFNSIDIGSLHESTLFFMCMYMFIGAGSTSTGGGIKLTTFFVIILSVDAFLRRKKDITIAKRSLSKDHIIRALAISSIALSFIVVSIFILTITEHASFIQIVFEVLSAFGTVGLTANTTFHLTDIGKFIIAFMMFLGKVGPLTLAYSLSRLEPNTKIRYPQEDILTG